ncbi:hydroxyethylthiazole kinase [Methanococcus voltae]|uniref:hydroxyethylthiazole kinase n=1 Tax=Methanococcus voltae TaxID=2188 RepID=UPI001AE9099C|nr:hydroxyethylthiazole kinase [Methanococcus voltae]MBP2144121.1 hydroxyethylthiazole kinase [Methanococcus voltae]
MSLNYYEYLGKVREMNPLVQSITNYVVMNSTANALLALGASPVMAHAKDELDEMVAIASSLVINIGTLDEYWIPSMKKAVKIATELDKPITLDPVGAGATKLRTNLALELLDIGNITTLRGNFGEVTALLGEHGKTRGVDSAECCSKEALETCLNASKEFNTTVAVTGKVDYVANKADNEYFAIKNGHEMLSKVTGTGCASTCVIGAFSAVERTPKAVASALSTYGLCAEKAVLEAPYPGSFSVKMYDWLYLMNKNVLKDGMKIEHYNI